MDFAHLFLSCFLVLSLSLFLSKLSHAAAKERATVRGARTCRSLSFNNLSLLAGECLWSCPRGQSLPILLFFFLLTAATQTLLFFGRVERENIQLLLLSLSLFSVFFPARTTLISIRRGQIIRRLLLPLPRLVLDAAGNVFRDYPRLLLLFKECLAALLSRAIARADFIPRLASYPPAFLSVYQLLKCNLLLSVAFAEEKNSS